MPDFCRGNLVPFPSCRNRRGRRRRPTTTTMTAAVRRTLTLQMGNRRPVPFAIVDPDDKAPPPSPAMNLSIVCRLLSVVGTRRSPFLPSRELAPPARGAPRTAGSSRGPPPVVLAHEVYKQARPVFLVSGKAKARAFEPTVDGLRPAPALPSLPAGPPSCGSFPDGTRTSASATHSRRPDSSSLPSRAGTIREAFGRRNSGRRRRPRQFRIRIRARLPPIVPDDVLAKRVRSN